MIGEAVPRAEVLVDGHGALQVLDGAGDVADAPVGEADVAEVVGEGAAVVMESVLETLTPRGHSQGRELCVHFS